MDQGNSGMDRRAFVAGLAAGVTSPAAAQTGAAPLAPQSAQSRSAQSRSWQSRLFGAARAQIGRTTRYVPDYRRIAYPGGDVPEDVGVCTDVVIRAYREAFGLDLQRLVHEDMRANFAAYPTRWGLRRPDTNIDHRRVPNLQVFFRRRGYDLPLPRLPGEWRAGDLATQTLPGNLPHIGIVTERVSAESGFPLMIHNIGRGTLEEDVLGRFPVTGRYHMPGAVA
jgi:uncharacterized protein